jgi:hypothetical protein
MIKNNLNIFIPTKKHDKAKHLLLNHQILLNFAAAELKFFAQRPLQNRKKTI